MRARIDARLSPSGTVWTFVRAWKAPGRVVIISIRSEAGAFRTVSAHEWDEWERAA